MALNASARCGEGRWTIEAECVDKLSSAMRFGFGGHLERPLVEMAKLRALLINGWNRLAVAFRTEPGTFQVGERPPDRPAVPSSEIKAAPLRQRG